MRISTRFATIRAAAVLLTAASALLSTGCSKNEENNLPKQPEQPSKYPAQEELIGAWDAEGYRWDLDAKGTCYLMDGYDYAVDGNGDYITVSIREYCEQYAADYNADEANTIKGTAEDFADNYYGDAGMFTNITITEDQIVIESGVTDFMTIGCVNGKYTYNQETGIITVEDVAIEDEPRTLEINVWKDDEGRMNFRYYDMDSFATPSYDQSKKYTVFAYMMFYCLPEIPSGE